MSKEEKRAQTCLYFGVLLGLIAADWHWYLGRYAGESVVAQLPFTPVIYVLWLAAVALCLGASVVFFWRARKQEAAYRTNRRKPKRR